MEHISQEAVAAVVIAFCTFVGAIIIYLIKLSVALSSALTEFKLVTQQNSREMAEVHRKIDQVGKKVDDMNEVRSDLRAVNERLTMTGTRLDQLTERFNKWVDNPSRVLDRQG